MAILSHPAGAEPFCLIRLQACQVLGISRGHVCVVDDPALPDGLQELWDTAIVARHVVFIEAQRLHHSGQVLRHGALGIIDVVGAIFGLEAVEDAPLRAVHAAMAIDKAVQRARLGEGDRGGRGRRERRR